MHDYPDRAKFLTDDERKEILRRLEEDRSVLADEFDIKYMWAAFKDWKIYVHMFITIGIYTPLYSISVFMPSIVKGLGYTNETAQLMTVPVYVVACVFTVVGGLAGDLHKQRGVYMIGFCLSAYVHSLFSPSDGLPNMALMGFIACWDSFFWACWRVMPPSTLLAS
jgi:sugar phosphate permease